MTYENNELKDWLIALSKFDEISGRCKPNLKSEFRGRLATIVNIDKKFGKEIFQIFDEKLWKHSGKYYEIDSDGLVELQNIISKTIQSSPETNSFNIGEKITNFIVKLSSLLPLLVLSFVISVHISVESASSDNINAVLVLSHLITLIAVSILVEMKSPVLKWGLIIFTIILNSIFYFAFLELSCAQEAYIAFYSLLNMSFFGGICFAMLSLLNEFTEKKIPSYARIILALVIYGGIIGTLLVFWYSTLPELIKQMSIFVKT